MAITITNAGEIVCDCGEVAGAADVWYAGLDDASYEGLESAQEGDETEKWRRC